MACGGRGLRGRNYFRDRVEGPYPGGSLASELVAMGGVYDTTNGFPEITFTNTSLTLDGWDFSVHGGSAIVIRGMYERPEIQNCKFNSINFTGMINIYTGCAAGLFSTTNLPEAKAQPTMAIAV